MCFVVTDVCKSSSFVEDFAKKGNPPAKAEINARGAGALLSRGIELAVSFSTGSYAPYNSISILRSKNHSLCGPGGVQQPSFPLSLSLVVSVAAALLLVPTLLGSRGNCIPLLVVVVVPDTAVTVVVVDVAVVVVVSVFCPVLSSQFQFSRDSSPLPLLPGEKGKGRDVLQYYSKAAAVCVDKPFSVKSATQYFCARPLFTSFKIPHILDPQLSGFEIHQGT